MMLFGFPLEDTECARLLRTTPGTINDLLYAQQSLLQYVSIDTGRGVLGIPMKSSSVYQTSSEMISHILETELKFRADVRLLQIDLSRVAIAHMDGDPEILEFPEPYVLHIS